MADVSIFLPAGQSEGRVMVERIQIRGHLPAHQPARHLHRGDQHTQVCEKLCKKGEKMLNLFLNLRYLSVGEVLCGTFPLLWLFQEPR